MNMYKPKEILERPIMDDATRDSLLVMLTKIVVNQMPYDSGPELNGLKSILSTMIFELDQLAVQENFRYKREAEESEG